MCTKQVGTYGFTDMNGRAKSSPLGSQTLGGYTKKMVVHEKFAIKIPDGYPLEMAGPVMCAGVTMYDPLKRQGATAGTRVGIIGLGGLGLTGIKIAKLMGCTVTAISRTGSEKARAGLSAGAVASLCSKDAAEMAAAAGSLDLILIRSPSRTTTARMSRSYRTAASKSSSGSRTRLSRASSGSSRARSSRG